MVTSNGMFGSQDLHFVFTATTFEYRWNYSTDAGYSKPPCYTGEAAWKEYGFGTYTVADTLLTLDGDYTDSAYEPTRGTACEGGPHAAGRLKKTYRLRPNWGFLTFYNGHSADMYKNGVLPNPDVVPFPPDSLQGAWRGSPSYSHPYPPDESNDFIFTGDSFRLRTMRHMWVPIFDSLCGSMGSYWQEHAKGHFTIADSILTLEGDYTDSNYAVNQGACTAFGPARTGHFTWRYRVHRGLYGHLRLDDAPGDDDYSSWTGEYTRMYVTGRVPRPALVPRKPMPAGPGRSVDGRRRPGATPLYRRP